MTDVDTTMQALMGVYRAETSAHEQEIDTLKSQLDWREGDLRRERERAGKAEHRVKSAEEAGRELRGKVAKLEGVIESLKIELQNERAAHTEAREAHTGPEKEGGAMSDIDVDAIEARAAAADYSIDRGRWDDVAESQADVPALVSRIRELEARLATIGGALHLVQSVPDMYRELVMDTAKDQELHARVTATADRAIAHIRAILYGSETP